MEMNNTLKQAYKEEISFIKEFHLQYTEQYDESRLEEDNPDVKQLIDSMALFMARSRLCGSKQINQLHHRVFHQLLPYLLTPIPAMGLVKLNADNLIEPIQISTATSLVLSTNDRNNENRQAIFRTMYDMSLQPLSLQRIGKSSYQKNTANLILRIQAQTASPGKLDSLSIYLHGQGNYQQSLALQQLLKKYTTNISVNFNTGKTVDCQYSLGTPAKLESHNNPEETGNIHPLERERSFFQLPQQAAYLNLKLDDSPAQWRYCDITIKLDCDWPSEIKLSSELFQLFVIPIENKILEQSKTIQYDGTQSQHLVMPPIIDPDLFLCSVEGVYQLESGKRIPIRPGILKGGHGSYQIYPSENSGSDIEPALPVIEVNLPQAFHSPQKLVVDGLWHHPHFSEVLGEKIAVRPCDLDIAGLSWKLLNCGNNTLIPYTQVAEYQPTQYLELSALKNKAILSFNEVLTILDSFSSIWQGEFKPLRKNIKDISVLPDKTVSSVEQVCLLYVIDFQPLELHMLPMAEIFLDHLENILYNWIGEANIKVVSDFGSPGNLGSYQGAGNGQLSLTWQGDMKRLKKVDDVF